MCYEAKVMPENMFGIEGDVLQTRVRRDADASTDQLMLVGPEKTACSHTGRDTIILM